MMENQMTSEEIYERMSIHMRYCTKETCLVNHNKLWNSADKYILISDVDIFIKEKQGDAQ